MAYTNSDLTFRPPFPWDLDLEGRHSSHHALSPRPLPRLSLGPGLGESEEHFGPLEVKLFPQSPSKTKLACEVLVNLSYYRK